jgi:hypothetical protein
MRTIRVAPGQPVNFLARPADPVLSSSKPVSGAPVMDRPGPQERLAPTIAGAPTHQLGQTATNPETGKQVVWNGRGFVPVRDR